MATVQSLKWNNIGFIYCLKREYMTIKFAIKSGLYSLRFLSIIRNLTKDRVYQMIYKKSMDY